ncbi:MAG: membrane integrity-associated transporter subunit PqiC [Proteobacteria bacterium]|uniref:ABC-type transport auxiliary lipoprotein family protein n=1 Tax=Rudaea sp. TaxID=2136325 RepID=UPI0032209048|nr:membrane integrity-associated transporter subunit PqiC [Pseudomonadota bacterium]
MTRPGTSKNLLRLVASSAVLLVLAACSPPVVPDVTYYQLPPPAPPPQRLQKPLTVLPIEVATFRAEGVYAEQSVLYATSPDAGALRAYHYQLWSDPPSRGLQARLTNRLREAGVSALVTDRLPASVQSLRIRGRILHYERVPQTQGAIARVEFEMRVEQDSGEPLLEQSYGAEQAASGETMAATAQAFGAAVDAAFAKFQADLVALEGGKP